MRGELDLPTTGPSQITLYLPNNSTLQATSKTQLPFKQLSTEAREATILPGLTKSLMSINKMAENGYTTIFRPGNKGVMIHKKGHTHNNNDQTSHAPRVQKKRSQIVDSINTSNGQ